MDNQPDLSSSPAKRSRLEVKTVLAVVIAVIAGGAIWVALEGSPTRNRAAIDSSANPTPTIVGRPTSAPSGSPK